MYVLNLNRTTHFTTTVLSASRDLCPVWLRRSKLLVMIDIQVCTGIALVFKPTLSLSCSTLTLYVAINAAASHRSR